MKDERLAKLEDYIKNKGICSLDCLCNEFDVSKTTIRRDIEILSSMGKIKKVYGGVTYNSTSSGFTVDFAEREENNKDKKIYLAGLAAKLINEGDTIFLDSGTTTSKLVGLIKDMRLNIITNSLNAANECAAYENLSIILCGGQYSRITNSFIGAPAIQTLQEFNIQKAFMAATGISMEAGITNSLPLESPVKKTAIAKSGEVYIMIDSSKWNVTSIMTYASFNEITGIITDELPPKEYIDYFEASGIRLIF